MYRKAMVDYIIHGRTYFERLTVEELYSLYYDLAVMEYEELVSEYSFVQDLWDK